MRTRGREWLERRRYLVRFDAEADDLMHSQVSLRVCQMIVACSLSEDARECRTVICSHVRRRRASGKDSAPAELVLIFMNHVLGLMTEHYGHRHRSIPAYFERKTIPQMR